MNTAPSLDAVADHTKTHATAAAIGVSPELHEAGLAAARRAWHAAKSNEATGEECKAAAQQAYDRVVASFEPAQMTREQVAGGGFTSPAANAPAFEVKASSEPDLVRDVRITVQNETARAIAAGKMDDAGRERSERDLATARAAGFSPKATVYQRGLRVDAGTHGVAGSRVEFEAKPLVTDACEKFIAQIVAEERRDVTARVESIGMTDLGELTIDSAVTARPSRSAFFSLVSRLGYGGGAYLERCPVVLRAANVNAQRVLITAAEADRRFEQGAKYEANELVMRQRTRPGLKGERETFGVVSTGYGAFDADRVARSIARATPAEARGGVVYDGMRSRFEVLFQTTAQPEGFVEGEFFRVGVHISTGDSGGNSIIVRAVIWQALCKNLLVIDQCSVPVASIRHVGTEMVLARRFEAAFARALKAIDPFLAAWNYARTDDVVRAARGTTEAPIAADPKEAIRGIFAGLLDRKMITPPAKETSAVVDDLVAAWERDESSATSSVRTSRAAVANAITAAAHAWELSPWHEDELQLQAGALLWAKSAGRNPAPLPYLEREQVIVTPAGAALS